MAASTPEKTTAQNAPPTSKRTCEVLTPALTVARSTQLEAPREGWPSVGRLLNEALNLVRTKPKLPLRRELPWRCGETCLRRWGKRRARSRADYHRAAHPQHELGGRDATASWCPQFSALWHPTIHAADRSVRLIRASQKALGSKLAQTECQAARDRGFCAAPGCNRTRSRARMAFRFFPIPRRRRWRRGDSSELNEKPQPGLSGPRLRCWIREPSVVGSRDEPAMRPRRPVGRSVYRNPL